MVSEALPTSPTSSQPSGIPVSSSSSALNHAHHFISIKLSATNCLFWRTQWLPLFRGQNLYGYIKGSHRCPSASIFIDIQTLPIETQHIHKTLPLAIGLNTSKAVWDDLAASLSSPSNTHILNLHMQLQNLKQDDLTVTQYLQKAKLISDELVAAGRPLSLVDHNIYIFKGLHSEFKDLVITLSARPEPVTFSELHSLLFNHDFIHGSSLSTLSISSTGQHDTSNTQVSSGKFTQRNNNSDRSFNSNPNRGHGRYNRGRGGRGGHSYNSRNYHLTIHKPDSL
ncbi:uncharacterized protein LOC125828777 [Solanum verrucosum]|uniref:uncharacterized protein LOC125828777 n=1 Tax=Solanum verrucosum TaxID=315347 RepID=UPI0020D010DA|nr:uncharacterized protein LOC125828777 [Solanum verrucosum]